MLRTFGRIMICTAMVGITVTLASSCTGGKEKSVADTVLPQANESSMETDSAKGFDITKEARKMLQEHEGENFLVVEQAVDAWFYYHLNDFASYKPLQRSSRYDESRGIYIHKCMYRAMNRQGGMETCNKEFEVDLHHPGDNGIPFRVTDITPSGTNPTER